MSGHGKPEDEEAKPAFFDSLARLFHPQEEAAPEREAAEPAFDSLVTSFDSALDGLEQRIEEIRSDSRSARRASAARRTTAEDRAKADQQRMERAHRAMLEDIEKMHARLATELAGTNLAELASYLQALHEEVADGKGSHHLLPRMRYAIVDRVVEEVGELAIARLFDRIEREEIRWPDPTCYPPSATPDEIERSGRRRLGEVREDFLAQDLERTAERAVGVVRGWKSDYPDRGSALWEDCVLQGVAAGIRGQLIRQATELLVRDRESILEQARASIGSELDALHAALESGVNSLEQAHRAVSSSLGVLDQVVPEIAWNHAQKHLPDLGAAPDPPPGRTDRQ